MGSFFKPLQGLPFDVFIPVLIVSHSFKEFHEIDVVPHFLRLTENWRVFYINLPVDVLDALPDLFFADLHDGLITSDFIEILDDGLKVESLSFLE